MTSNVSTSLSGLSTGVSASVEGVRTADPMQAGITALRDAGLDPLRLWSLKAPKDAGGTVSAVFLQARSEVVLMHQLTSGRYVLFWKMTLEQLLDAEGA